MFGRLNMPKNYAFHVGGVCKIRVTSRKSAFADL